MKGDPCSVCGGTDMNLVDGYYYCVECGTQDENVRETVVEQTKCQDIIMRSTTRKIVKEKQIEMSPEWNKWHTFNFILSGLANELITLGVEPSFKPKLLWIWSRYIKMFQKKEESICQSQKDNNIDFFLESDNSDDNIDYINKDKIATSDVYKVYDIDTMTISVLHAMLYVALNLDNSDFQLSHLIKYIRSGGVSSIGCDKYVPKEINVSNIPQWQNFRRSKYAPSTKPTLRRLVISMFKRLDLGLPNMPDMKKIVDRYIQELCLPDDFRSLIYSLMLEIPWKHLLYNAHNKTTILPDFEGIAMAYILMGLKICFGLDDEYEINISETVEKINDENNYPKSYKFDMFADQTNRLLSFREWANYIQFRKIILCKYHFGYALQNGGDVEDYLFMAQTEHVLDRYWKKDHVTLRNQMIIDIIKKISSQNTEFEKFKIEFPHSLTPLSTYTDILTGHVEDPDLKLLLSEDFTKYSMRYGTIDFNIIQNEENVVRGVNEINKVQDNLITWYRHIEGYDKSMVFIRNCENKNWLITNPPQSEHITNEKDESKLYDKISDHDNNSSQDFRTNDIFEAEHTTTIINTIEEENEDNIFDDSFTDNNYDIGYTDQTENDILYPNNDLNLTLDIDNKDSLQMTASQDSEDFDPTTFNRNEAIKQLILLACKKHNICIPKEYKTDAERKRKSYSKPDQAIEVKRRKQTNEKTNGQTEVDKLIDAYNRNMIKEMIEKELSLSKHEFKFNDLENGDLTQISCNNPILNDSQNEITMNASENASLNHDLTDPPQNDMTDECMNTENIDNRNFDESIYDIKQLYIKYKELDLDNTSLNEDPELNSELLKVIEENEVSIDKECLKPVKYGNNNNIIKKYYKKCKNERKSKTPLLSDNKIKEFGYWIKHYKGIDHNRLSTRLFDSELYENFPKSFYFVLHTCSTISETPMINIYTYLVKLESYLL